jgi:hypothetical protein
MAYVNCRNLKFNASSAGSAAYVIQADLIAANQEGVLWREIPFELSYGGRMRIQICLCICSTFCHQRTEN